MHAHSLLPLGYIAQHFCHKYVSGLAAFVTTTQQHDDAIALVFKIDSVARTKVDPQLAYTFPHGFYVAR
ncbi:hypothetical protein ECL_00273 [Enterobacter cloacae subsp. cloacae ATCC 13047]|uniref:Uncharacterized protein n=1 Tax=Enterobacter cloacae subsp. cloacae (strain ATCC 13047 / DSM 30054 / NBRC 13535 / NCTC 10005 / WDCM 00083 / NCDC 279-56) TaxID=716541 RepID=A0A0H3CF01_ENTCC|nr:hypothetical protein ECL_00273 [Enterobacter cloacae subsp. cloacae ATCC 13047]